MNDMSQLTQKISTRLNIYLKRKAVIVFVIYFCIGFVKLGEPNNALEET